MDVNSDLLKKVEKKSGLSDSTEAVNMALKEYLRVQNLKPLMDMAGSVDFDADWDYRKQRGK
jgi:hypothetical protein